MNKKLMTLLVLCLCMTATLVYAEQDYKDRNIFNWITDWSASLGKSASEKMEIVNERVEKRAIQRKADDTFKELKRELNNDYAQELVSIRDNNSYSAEEMAKELNDAYSNHKNKLRELEKGYLHD